MQTLDKSCSVTYNTVMTATKPAPLVALGEKLRELRELRGWSLREAEHKTGVSNGYIYLLEKARVTTPSPKILEKLGSAYEFDYNCLLQLAGYLDAVTQAGATRDDETLMSIISSLDEGEKAEVKSFLKYLASRK